MMDECDIVRDFGADPDGLKDSTKAILDALNACGNVYAPAGTFLTDGDALVRQNSQNQRIRGAGLDITRLRALSAGSMFEWRGSGSFEMSDMTLEGVGVGTKAVFVDYALPSAPSGVLFRRLRINGFTTEGIATSPTGSQAVDWYLEHNYIHGNGGRGLYINRPAVLRLLANRFSTHTVADVDLTGAGGVGVAVSAYLNNFDGGGACGLRASRISGIDAASNYFEGKSAADMYFESCYGPHVIGGFHSSGVLGVHLKGCTNITVLDPAKVAGPYASDFIRIEDCNRGLVVTGERDDVPSDGIRLIGRNTGVILRTQSGLHTAANIVPAIDNNSILGDEEAGVCWADAFLGYVALREIADPAAPASGRGRVYLRRDAGGKMQLTVRFPSGDTQVITTER